MAKTRTIRSNNVEQNILTAAAQVIDLSKPVYSNNGQRNFTQQWQKRSWEMFEEIGEVSNACNYMGDQFSQLRMWIGCNVENELIELTPDEIPTELAGEISPEQVLQAQGYLDALNHPHGLPEIQRMFGMGLFQVGESYLLGTTNENGEEEWDAYSTEQVFINTENKYSIRQSPIDNLGKTLDEEDFMLRLWRRDPRWPQLANSSLKSALMILEELLLLTLEVRAVVSSRIPAGIVIFPESMELVQADNTSGDSGQNGSASDLLSTIQKHITTAITTPGSAAAAAPIMMRAHPDDISKVLEVKFGRDLSENALLHRKELIERFASAINLPGEILMGKSGLNHWSAWLIDTEALNNHIQPMAKVMTSGLTHQYLLPRMSIGPDGLPTDNVPPFVIGFEMAEKLEDPEQTKIEMWAYDEGLISMDAMAKRIDIKDEERPSPEEYAQRMAQKQPVAVASIGGKQPPPNPEQIASGAPKKQLHFAHKERELRVRLQVAADAAMTRALEKAGAKLRSMAQRDKVSKEKIAASSVPNELLISKFPDLLLSLKTDAAALLAGSFVQFGDYWDSNVDDAQSGLLNDVPGLTLAQQKEAQRRFDSARAAGKVAVIASLTSLASQLAFNPHPDAPPMGEFDSSLRIQAGLIRNSLMIAGGSDIAIDDNVPPIGAADNMVGGLFSSAIAVDLFTQSPDLTLGSGGTWIWGPGIDKGGTFEPHYALDTLYFSSPEDSDVLGTEGEDWLDSSVEGCYSVGDHNACGCDTELDVTFNDNEGDVSNAS